MSIFPTMTLGELIDAFSTIEADHVMFDFGGLYPDGFSSWRGIYEHLAMNWATPSEINNRRAGKPFVSPSVRAAQLLQDLQNQLGSSHEGYKGGTYYMDRETPVWVDRYGESSCTAITGIRHDGAFVYIETAHRQPY